MLMPITYQIARSGQDLQESLEIRKRVFVREQGIPPEFIEDGEGPMDIVLIRNSGKPAGTARILYQGTRAKIEAFAILKQYRGKGLGREAFRFITEYCRKKGLEEIFFNAQYYLKDFYLSLGFRTRGSRFLKANIEHIEMFMMLSKGGRIK
jgi:predicted GNAT family N-acyltransferase